MLPRLTLISALIGTCMQRIGYWRCNTWPVWTKMQRREKHIGVLKLLSKEYMHKLNLVALVSLDVHRVD